MATKKIKRWEYNVRFEVGKNIRLDYETKLNENSLHRFYEELENKCPTIKKKVKGRFWIVKSNLTTVITFVLLSGQIPISKATFFLKKTKPTLLQMKVTFANWIIVQTCTYTSLICRLQVFCSFFSFLFLFFLTDQVSQFQPYETSVMRWMVMGEICRHRFKEIQLLCIWTP